MRWLLKFSAIIALSCLSYIAAIDSTAQIWSPPTNISRTSPLGISIFPAITIDSLGNPHAVWQAKFLPGMLGDKYEIVYSRWDGAKWLREGAAPKNISHTMDLFFDPKMLEVLEVKEGNFLRSIGGNTFWKPPVVDNQVGAIKDIISTRLTPGEAEGEGILLVIRFRSKAKGKSVIGFTRLKLSDEQAKPIAGLPMEGIIDTSGLSTTFTAVPRIENNLVVLDIQSSKAINVKWFSLDIEYPDALELIEGKTHIEGGKIPESGIVATLKFRIWESGKMYFHLKNGITKGLLDDTGMPTLIDGNITMMVSPAWDVNKDYIVDIFDMVILGTNLDKKITGKPRPNPDVTGDGIVDLFDFVKVGANFGATYSAITGARISPIMIDQHSLAFSKQLAFQYLPLWQNLYEKLKMNPNLSEEFVKTKFLLQDLIALASSQMAPIQTKLMQNYPNPFNPETWIPYQLSEAANVIVHIYDSIGRLVRALNIGQQPAGIYVSKERAAYWDGKNEMGETVASGVYYYSIKANGFRAIRRMTLLK